MSHAKFRSDALKTVAVHKEQRTDRQTNKRTDIFGFIIIYKIIITTTIIMIIIIIITMSFVHPLHYFLKNLLSSGLGLLNVFACKYLI